MYNSISGTLTSINPTLSTIMCTSGVEYSINTPLTVFTSLSGKLNTQVQLFTKLIVREDDMSIYGFLTEEDRNLFDFFVSKVSGVGAKTSLSILSTFSYSEISTFVLDSDSKNFSKVPGIGKKSANRILFELKDKFPKLTATSSVKVPQHIEDSVLTLVSLGLLKTKAESLVQSIIKEDPTLNDVSVIVQKALTS